MVRTIQAPPMWVGARVCQPQHDLIRHLHPSPVLAMQPHIRVLVVDDSSFFRRALSAEIEKNPLFKIIGSAGDGREAIDKVR